MHLALLAALLFGFSRAPPFYDAPEPTPRPPERARPAHTEEAKPDKFKPDEIAKALARDKVEPKPRHNAPAYDPSSIAKLIGQTRTAEAAPNARPPQGLANHHAAR